MRGILRAAAAAALVAGSASAQSFPARSGELGILDVPDAEVGGMGRNRLAAEMRFDRVSGGPSDFGPMPVYAVFGVLPALDLGLTMREWGQPGDPRPARMLFGTAAKLQLWAPTTGPLRLAASGILDRINDATVAGGRVALSTANLPVRLAGFLGLEVGTGAAGKKGGAAGLAAEIPLGFAQLVTEAVIGPRGQNYGAALRWSLSSTTGISLGANYLPDDKGFRVALGFGFWPSRPAVAPTRVPELPSVPQAVKGALAFTDDRPHFRLRIPTAGVAAQPGHLQYGPILATARGTERPVVGESAKAKALSIESLAETQLREQEDLAGARERRVRSTSEQLDAREKAAIAEAARLEDRERELTVREQQLDERERRIVVRGAPTQQQRQLESLEAQLAAQERQILAQERSLAPAIDAAQGRERDAATREESERQEMSRLQAAVTSAASNAQQLEIRKQAVGAKNRQLAALEARLVAKGERIDALERRNRAKRERLDAWSRRLETRSERLDLLEKRAAQSRPPAPTKAVTEPKIVPAQKDKAAFVMVVKSPTAIMKERGAASAGPAQATALHPGVAVEKAVAAATVVTFPTPASALSELDRETIDNIAKLAAKQRCELLIWARAKDPSLMGEAQRRVDEIKTRAIASGPVDAKQVVVRITTRPGAQGVDVVVSALRETTGPAAPAPAPSGAATLEAGESGKRQIREAVQTVQSSIEACVADAMEQRKLARAEGVLKLTISTAGKVSKVASGGDLAGTSVEECLSAASGGWAFPRADAEYVVDVPITVVRGGQR